MSTQTVAPATPQERAGFLKKLVAAEEKRQTVLEQSRDKARGAHEEASAYLKEVKEDLRRAQQDCQDTMTAYQKSLDAIATQTGVVSKLRGELASLGSRSV